MVAIQNFQYFCVCYWDQLATAPYDFLRKIHVVSKLARKYDGKSISIQKKGKVKSYPYNMYD